MTGKDVLSEEDLVEKVVAIKRFEYSLLGKAFQKQTNVIKKTDRGYEQERRQKK